MKGQPLQPLLRFGIEDADSPVVALAGNPNTGKTTIFNALTGLNQHTGNWPGKTVVQARGKYCYGGQEVILVDLPGTYSLLANSVEEQIARDFIYFGRPDATIVVADATCLERNLNLLLQVVEITPLVILCINLIDEARRKLIKIDFARLAERLGIPVVPASARTGEGLELLKKTVQDMISGKLKPSPKPIIYDGEVEGALHQILPEIKGILGDDATSRWLALRLLEGDETVLEGIQHYLLTDPPARLEEVFV
ncbi:MAG: iron transporter FeoB [Firmicutes bacterium]|jgi:Fe2+ transport system protein B|nr:iron transporter FeoB [Bacillota bacterium]